ncbi:MAG: threonine synthase [Gammaproteobacteria bacterium]|nr:threonine synthase [Gammaproteobacteria bacterium]MBT8106254.1 threonine synthase [Gammaproteobacteria bacterium]NNK26268.1 threonine synthase [Woeseiaceae bacterium]
MIGYCCIACAKTQAADFDGFVCPACGNNLDIIYDYAAAAAAFTQKLGSQPVDIFDYAELLPVVTESAFPLRIGATPLYAATALGEFLGLTNLYLKDESGNPSASIKDRASAIAVQRAIDTGADIVATASTGNAGSSLACLSAALGVRAVVFVPETAPAAKLTQLLSYGARVLAVRGSYDDCFDLCMTACEEFGWFNRNTGHNPFTREGKKTCAYEIWRAFGGELPDRIVVATGDGNIISGIWKGCRDLQAAGLAARLPRIDAAQSVDSAAISHSVHRLREARSDTTDWTGVEVDKVAADTIADSIAVDEPRDGLAAVRAVIESGGEAVTVPDAEILDAIPLMSRLAGVFPEPAAAAALAAVKRMRASGTIDATERVVCVVTGNGLKDTGSAARAAGHPTVIEPRIESVRTLLPRILS